MSAEPMETNDPLETPLEAKLTEPPHLAGTPRCQARSKQTSEQCRRAASPGQQVCVSHGAGSPQARARARQRLAELVEPGLEQLAEDMENADKPGDRIRAASEILRRAAFAGLLNELPPATTGEEARRQLLAGLLAMREQAIRDAEQSRQSGSADGACTEGET